MQVPFGLFASTRRRGSCGSASRRSLGARLPRRLSCRQLRRRALPLGTQMPCFCLSHFAVRQGKTKLTWVVPGAETKTLLRRHTSRRHSRVIILHACIACQCISPSCAWARVCRLLCVCTLVCVLTCVRCWCVGVSVGAGLRTWVLVHVWVLVCACARVCLHISPRIYLN